MARATTASCSQVNQHNSNRKKGTQWSWMLALTSPKFILLAALRTSVMPRRSFILRYLHKKGSVSGLSSEWRVGGKVGGLLLNGHWKITCVHLSFCFPDQWVQGGAWPASQGVVLAICPAWQLYQLVGHHPLCNQQKSGSCPHEWPGHTWLPLIEQPSSSSPVHTTHGITNGMMLAEKTKRTHSWAWLNNVAVVDETSVRQDGCARKTRQHLPLSP